MLSQLITAELRDTRPNKHLAQQPRNFTSPNERTLVGSKQSRKPKPYDSEHNKTKAATSTFSEDANKRNTKLGRTTNIQLKMKVESDPCAVPTFATSLYPPYNNRKAHHRFCSSQLSPPAVLAIQGRALFNLVSLLKSSPDLMMIYRRQERSRMAASCYVSREVLGNNAESMSFGNPGTVGVGGAIKGKKGSIIGAVMGSEPAQMKLKGVIATKGEIRSIKNSRLTESRPTELSSEPAPWSSNEEETIQSRGDLSHDTSFNEDPTVQGQEEENAIQQAAEEDILARLYEPPEFRLYASREVDRTSFSALKKVYLPKRKKPKTWFRETERFATKSVAYARANAKSESPEYQEYAPLVDCCVPRRFVPSQRNHVRFAHLHRSSPLRRFYYDINDINTGHALEELQGDVRSKWLAEWSEVDPEDEQLPCELNLFYGREYTVEMEQKTDAKSTETEWRTPLRKTHLFKSGEFNDFDEEETANAVVTKTNGGDKWTTLFHHALTSLSQDIKEMDSMAPEKNFQQEKRGKFGKSVNLRADKTDKIKKSCNAPFKSKARKSSTIHFSEKAITVDSGFDEQHLRRPTVCRTTDNYQQLSVPCTSVTEATVTTSTCSSLDEVSLMANIVQKESGILHTSSEQTVENESSTVDRLQVVPHQKLHDEHRSGGEIMAKKVSKELGDEETGSNLSTNVALPENRSLECFAGSHGPENCSFQYHTNGISPVFGDGCLKSSMRFSSRETATSLPTSPSRSPAVSKLSRRTVSSSSHRKHIEYLVSDDFFEFHGKENSSENYSHTQFQAVCKVNHQRKHNKFWQAFQWLGFW